MDKYVFGGLLTDVEDELLEGSPTYLAGSGFVISSRVAVVLLERLRPSISLNPLLLVCVFKRGLTGGAISDTLLLEGEEPLFINLLKNRCLGLGFSPFLGLSTVDGELFPLDGGESIP